MCHSAENNIKKSKIFILLFQENEFSSLQSSDSNTLSILLTNITGV